MSVHLIEMTDPFNPFLAGHHSITAGETVLTGLQQCLGKTTAFIRPTLCWLNGQVLLRAEWATVQLQDRDILHLVTLPGDPISLMVVAAVSVASLAITTSLTPRPTLPGYLPEADPVYSLLGTRNQNRLNQPIEVPYGCVRLWPSFAAQPYTQYASNEQILYQLFCLGQGEYDIESKDTAIKIEETTIADLNRDQESVTVEIVPPGESVTLFPDQVHTSQKVTRLTLSDSDWLGGYAASELKSLANAIEVDLELPFGLYRIHGHGSSVMTVKATFEYREMKEVEEEWQPLLSFEKTLSTQTSQRFTLRRDKLPLGQYEVRGKLCPSTGSNNGKGTIENTLYWTALRAFIPSSNDYGNVTLLAVRIRASQRLNDQKRHRINVVATRQLPWWDTKTQQWQPPRATQSPVWAFCDLFRSTYGGRIPDALDLEALTALDTHFTQSGDSFNWVFDQKTTVWEAAQTIGRVGRAIPVLCGPTITLIRDERKRLPIAIFNPENIVAGSLRWDIQFRDPNAPSIIEIEYVDPDTWEKKTVPCALPEPANHDRETVPLPGCTSRKQAYREGMFLVSSQQLLRENITFKTGLEGHIPQLGDLIQLNSPAFRWGQSGFVVARSESQLMLSEPVTFQDDFPHYLLLRNRFGESTLPMLVTPGKDALHVVVNDPAQLTDVVFTTQREATEPPLYYFGPTEQWGKRCKVIGIQPDEQETITITGLNYDDAVYKYDDALAPIDNTLPKTVTSHALPTVDGLKIDQVDSPDDLSETERVSIVLSWNPAAGATEYQVEQQVSGHWVFLATTQETFLTTQIKKDSTQFRVAGINLGIGQWSWVTFSPS